MEESSPVREFYSQSKVLELVKICQLYQSADVVELLDDTTWSTSASTISLRGISASQDEAKTEKHVPDGYTSKLRTVLLEHSQCLVSVRFSHSKFVLIPIFQNPFQTVLETFKSVARSLQFSHCWACTVHIVFYLNSHPIYHSLTRICPEFSTRFTAEWRFVHRNPLRRMSVSTTWFRSICYSCSSWILAFTANHYFNPSCHVRVPEEFIVVSGTTFFENLWFGSMGVVQHVID